MVSDINKQSIKIGILIPTSGTGGLFGPSCRDCAILASEEINANGGILGRPLELVFVDAGQAPAQLVSSTVAAVRNEQLVGLIGSHDSQGRNAIVKRLGGRVPYVYTPPYEGTESSHGVFVLGETPYQQLGPALPWFFEKHKKKNWYLIGNDYVWPRMTNWIGSQFIDLLGGRILGEEYVPFEQEEFDDHLRRIELAGPDAILVTLVGECAVRFNRKFAERGLTNMMRFGTLIEENCLLGIGPDGTQNMYSASGYFAALKTADNQTFVGNYMSRFGNAAPVLNVVGQSCYEGVHMFRRLATRADSFDLNKMVALASGLHYSSPRGLLSMNNFHVQKPIHIARADGIDFNVEQTFADVSAHGPSH